MKETTSLTITYQRRLTMREVLDLYSLAKGYHGSVFFYNQTHVVNGSQLPRLVSFFLTIKKNSDFLIVVEGTENETFLARLKPLFMASDMSIGCTISIEH